MQTVSETGALQKLAHRQLGRRIAVSDTGHVAAAGFGRQLVVVTGPDLTDPDAICVTLFEEDGEAMGWFIGPVVLSRQSGASMPYLPKSARRRIATAFVTAMGEAVAGQLDICVVDPHDLLAQV